MTRNLKAIVLALAAASFGSSAQAATLQFNNTTGVTSSITLSEPLEFTANANYNNDQVQVRIYDLYPGTLQINFGTTQNTFSVTVGSTPAAMSSNTFVQWSNVGGSSSAGDAIWWFAASPDFNITAGQKVTIGGSSPMTFAGTPVALPTPGTYQAVLVNANDGSVLSAPVNLNVALVPEASASILILSGALAFGLRRRR